MRGQLGLAFQPAGSLGNTPRVRGLHNLYVTCHCSDRNTPVCTGTAWLMALRWDSLTEYPRLCGDCTHSIIPSATYVGIPPSVRGLPIQNFPLNSPIGNTPVCTGTTQARIPRSVGRREYPRVRGDNRVILPTKSAPNGILPLVRGLPLMTSRCYWEIGGVR